MEVQFRTTTIGDGFALHVAPTDKFKTTTMQLVLRRPLTQDEHTETAVLPFVLRRGTRHHPTVRDIARHLEELYGAQFAADVGKVGETQNVELMVQTAHEKFLPESVDLTRAAVEFLAEALLDPAPGDGGFKGEYAVQEAEALRRRIERMINNPPQYAVHRLREEMCQEEPYGLHRYGDKEALSQIEAERLYRHYEHVLRTSPADMFVVGPVDPEAVERLVREHLALPRARMTDAPPVAAEAPVSAEATGAGGGRLVVEEQPVQQGVLTIGFRTGARYPDDDYGALLVYNGMLGGYPHSKLFVNVREKASLAYFASSQLEATKGVLIVAAGIAVEKFDEALAIVRAQVEAMASGDFTDDELDQTKKGLVNDLLSGRDSPGRIIASRHVGIVNGRVREAPETAAAVQAVTKADVRRVAEQIVEDTVYFLRSPKTD